MPDERPAEPKSFWATLPGILTALAGVCAAITALITALVTAGLVGRPGSPPTTLPIAPGPSPAAVSQPSAPPAPTRDEQAQAELEETRRRLAEATRARQQAEDARARADAEAARLRQAQATAAAEAKRQSELEAARRKAEEADAARARAEAEIARLRREAAAQAAAGTSRPAPSTPPAGPSPAYDNAPTRDAIAGFRVLSVSGEEVEIEVAFSYDPRLHGERVLAGAQLLNDGAIISGFRPATASWQRGKAVIRLVVRTARGRQSDAIEVFLYKSGEKPFLNRRFPYARTFD